MHAFRCSRMGTSITTSLPTPPTLSRVTPTAISVFYRPHRLATTGVSAVPSAASTRRTSWCVVVSGNLSGPTRGVVTLTTSDPVSPEDPNFVDALGANKDNLEALYRVGGDGDPRHYGFIANGDGLLSAAHRDTDETRIAVLAESAQKWEAVAEEAKSDAAAADAKAVAADANAAAADAKAVAADAKAVAADARAAAIETEIRRMTALPRLVESCHRLLASAGYYICDAALRQRYEKTRAEGGRLYWIQVSLRKAAINEFHRARTTGVNTTLESLPPPFRASLSASVVIFQALSEERNFSAHDPFKPDEFNDVVRDLEGHRIHLPEEMADMLDERMTDDLVAGYRAAMEKQGM